MILSIFGRVKLKPVNFSKNRWKISHLGGKKVAIFYYILIEWKKFRRFWVKILSKTQVNDRYTKASWSQHNGITVPWYKLEWRYWRSGSNIFLVSQVCDSHPIPSQAGSNINRNRYTYISNAISPACSSQYTRKYYALGII